MESDSIIAVLGLIFGILSFLLSIFLLTVKSEKRISNILIASFLMLTAIDVSVFFYHGLIELPASIEMLRIRSSAFKSPLLFLYILSVVKDNFKLKPIHLLNILPFLIEIVVLLPNFFLVSTAEQSIYLNNYFDQPEVKWITVFGYSVSVVYVLFYCWVVIRYKKLLLENYATYDSLVNYRFLKQLIIFIIIGFSITTFKEVMLFNAGKTTIDKVRIVMLLYGIFFISWLVLKALHAPKLFRGIEGDVPLVKDMLQEEKVAISIVENEDAAVANKLNELQTFMQKEEPYLNPSLTVKDLSKLVGIPDRELSILVNHHLGQHFFDFINEYRIKKAMNMLRAPEYKQHTVLEILYEVGFNSKSPFNAAFKKFAKMTPTAYRKSHS